MSLRIEDMVRAAKKFDFENRPKGKLWTSVPDSQVARLLQGAMLEIERTTSQRRDILVTEE